MLAEQIIQLIEQRVMSSRPDGRTYKVWYVGVTDDPKRRKEEHESKGENINFWIHWQANSESIARAVETFFLDKGMKGGTGGGDRPTFVYIF